MFVCCECCVSSGRGLCDELITRPEESYRLWCVVVCDLENLVNEEAMTRVGSQRHKKKKIHEDLCTLITFSGSFLLGMGCAVDNSCRENKNTHFMFDFFFQNIVSCMR